MGLDMYLEKAKIGAEKYLHTDIEELKITNDKEFVSEVLPLLYHKDGFRYLTTEVFYWRKANYIHNWFSEQSEDGLDNCERLEVTKKMLQNLIDTCEEVLINKNGEEKLPTTSGYFFGGTEYDEWYYEELERTVNGLKFLLLDFDFETKKIYYHGWW